MNCPYCDETTHPLAKFCSKCGLPLKEDTTVMGAYATDDTGPSPMVVGGGALAIVVIALTLGWMGSRKNEARPPSETVRRDSAGAFPAPPPPSGLALSRYNTGIPSSVSYSRPTGPSATYNPSVRWAWTPAPQPVQPQMNWTPEVAPPPVMLASINPIIFRKPTIVEPPKATAPAIPPLPADVYVPTPVQPTMGVGYDTSTQTAPGLNAFNDPNSLPPGYLVAPNGQVGSLNANGVFEPATDLAPSVSTGDDRSMWVWDPVNERWAIHSDRAGRGGRRVGGRSALGQPR